MSFFLIFNLIFTVPARVRSVLTWNEPDKAQWDSGIRMILTHFKSVKQVTWHNKGDYFSTVMPEGDNRSVLIHQLSRRRSQLPFSKSKGLVQCTLFHPLRPYLFVAVISSFPHSFPFRDYQLFNYLYTTQHTDRYCKSKKHNRGLYTLMNVNQISAHSKIVVGKSTEQLKALK